MREAGVDLGTIGLFALVGTPYTIKFLWAPLVDALDVPLLSRWLGRRRGWLVLLAAPADGGDRLPRLCRSGGGAVAGRASARCSSPRASATQDILIDAFRVESLDESEQAAGMASYVAAYRIGMLVSTARRAVSSAASKRSASAGQRAPGAAGYAGDGGDGR